MKQETPLEYILTHRLKKDMAAYLNSNPAHFDEVLQLTLSDRQPHAWRAAWLIGDALKKDDPRLKAYIDQILAAIPNSASGHQRQLLKLLYHQTLNETQEGLLLDICVGLWEQTDQQPSVRHTAMKLILALADKYPELDNELSAFTQSHYMESLSPGIKYSIQKMLRNRNKDRIM